MRPAIDLAGRRFGRLTVVSRAGSNQQPATICDVELQMRLRQ